MALFLFLIIVALGLYLCVHFAVALSWMLTMVVLALIINFKWTLSSSIVIWVLTPWPISGLLQFSLIIIAYLVQKSRVKPDPAELG